MKKTLAALATTALLATGAAALSSPAEAHKGGDRGKDHRASAFAITETNQLLALHRGDARRVGTVSGLSGDTSLIGSDFRPATDTLYVVGDQGGIYTVSTKTARATKVSQLSVALEGTLFGVDFNPAADRLRVISDTGQNLRHNVDVATGGTIVDGRLSVPAGHTGAAYTNNDESAATATVLYDLNTATDQLVMQNPANDGTIIPVGSLGVAADASSGFDIASRIIGGRTVSNAAYAVLSVGGDDALYSIDLTSGQATRVANLSDRLGITDIALPN